MEPDSFALRTGLFILITAALLAATVVLFTRSQMATTQYQVLTEGSVSGLDVQSRVYYKGVEVGTVTDISFQADNYNVVRILIDIDERIPLGENTFAQLSLRGITGEYDLTLDNDGPLGKPISGSAGQPANIPMKAEYIAQLGETLAGALDEMRGLAQNLRQLTENENRDKVSTLLDSLNSAALSLDQLGGRIDQTLDEVVPAVNSFSRAMDGIDATARSLANETAGLDHLVSSLDQTMQALHGLLETAESETLSDVDDTLATLQTALVELARLSESLQRDPQSLLLGQAPPKLGPGETLENPR